MNQTESAYGLPSSNHTERYGKEIIQKLRSNDRFQELRIFKWAINNPDWTCFAGTFVFDKSRSFRGQRNWKTATIQEFEHYSLKKIKRRLCRDESKWVGVLPWEHLYQYEYTHESRFGHTKFFRKLPHIHAILPVPTSLAPRIYDYSINRIDQRLYKDLRSLPSYLSVLIEPLRMDRPDDWFRYILKGKTMDEVNFR